MSWSLSHIFPATPGHVDRALNAAGRALYLANAYESKCHFVLRIAELSEYIERVPCASFAEALASASRDRLLGPVIARLSSVAKLDQNESAKLNEAKDGRNFIAHEGAAFGYVYSANESTVYSHIARLRTAVRQLVAGDNLVSKWVYEIEEKEPPPNDLSHSYSSFAEKWVFEFFASA